VFTWVTEHIRISFFAILLSTLLGLAIGFFIAGKGRERTADAVLYLAEILMTVPSLALFGLLMFVLSSLGFSAIGFLPAVITLIIYGQLPIIRNTYEALNTVDRRLIEAGRGMGMSHRQVLYKVKIPLAAPIIMAGLRNASILIIGIATIAALIGSGGLGVPIFRGLRNARMDLVILGGVLVSMLAVFVDVLMAMLQRLVTPRGIGKTAA
jgi:osmoprotectant transport system permease protein